MFENYREMSDEDKAKVKAIHIAIRGDLSHGDRYRILAWGFVRGFPYRRMERKRHTQGLFEHNKPRGEFITQLLAAQMPEFKGKDAWYVDARVSAWLNNPDGAIPAPPPRPKKPYVRPDFVETIRDVAE